MSESPAVFLDVYFNSKGKHSPFALEPPQIEETRGFYVPWTDRGQAYRSWRSTWRVLDSDSGSGKGPWEPGLRVLEVEATESVHGYTPVSGKMLAVRLLDVAAETETFAGTDETKVTYWIEFVTMYCPMDGVLGYVQPSSVLPTYGGTDGRAFIMPDGGSTAPFCAPVTGTVGQNGLRISSSSQVPGDPNLMSTVVVRFADFKDTLYKTGAIRIFISVFAEIRYPDGQTLRFYDDPEMDVNVP